MSRGLISVHNLSFRYNRDRVILDDIHAELTQGQLVSLLGPNGAGKSTLLKCIMGLLRPFRGQITVDQRNVLDLSYRERAALVAYVPQHSSVIFDHSVRDYVAMGLASRYPMWRMPSAEDMKEVDQYLERMELTSFADAPFRSLSGGEQQKTTIARALVQRPEILLFDEPTSALDLGNQTKVLQLIKGLAEDGYSILMTTHNPDHPFLLGSDVWMLNQKGKLISGELSGIMTPENISQLYGTSVDVVFLPEQNRTVCIANTQTPSFVRK